MTATKDSTLKTKPSAASSAMPGALSAKIFDDVEVEGEVVAEDDIAAMLAGADLSEEFQDKAKTVFEALLRLKSKKKSLRLRNRPKSKSPKRSKVSRKNLLVVLRTS